MKIYYLETEFYWFLVRAKKEEDARDVAEKEAGPGTVQVVRPANSLEIRYFKNLRAREWIMRANEMYA